MKTYKFYFFRHRHLKTWVTGVKNNEVDLSDKMCDAYVYTFWEIPKAIDDAAYEKFWVQIPVRPFSSPRRRRKVNKVSRR